MLCTPAPLPASSTSLWRPDAADNRSLGQHVRAQLKCDGTRWRTGGEVKGKLANGVGIQYPSHYLGTWCIRHYYRWCAHLGWRPVVDWTDAPADLNGLVRFAERRKLVSARVPSHIKRSLLYTNIHVFAFGRLVCGHDRVIFSFEGGVRICHFGTSLIRCHFVKKSSSPVSEFAIYSLAN
jgi:hypothetical protein